VKNKQGYSHFEATPKKRREAPVPLPDVINMDELATQTDDALIERLRTLESHRDKAYDVRFDTRSWEVEASYIRRELQLRRHRHQLHEQYLSQLEKETRDVQRLEDSYPVADLDNSEFMFFN
jgi:hypothetical protein